MTAGNPDTKQVIVHSDEKRMLLKVMTVETKIMLVGETMGGGEDFKVTASNVERKATGRLIVIRILSIKKISQDMAGGKIIKRRP